MPHVKSYNSTGMPVGAKAKKLVVKNQSPIPIVRAISCADCGSAIDQPCVGPDGKPNKHAHRVRRRMAVRARNLALALSVAAATLETTTTQQETHDD